MAGIIPKRIVFVCAANKYRSPTAEEVAKRLARKAGKKVFGIDSFLEFDYEILSAGTDACDEGRQFTEELGKRMDIIVSMDHYIWTKLQNEFKVPRHKITGMDIPDQYQRNDPELIKILEEELHYILQSEE